MPWKVTFSGKTAHHSAVQEKEHKEKRLEKNKKEKGCVEDVL